MTAGSPPPSATNTSDSPHLPEKTTAAIACPACPSAHYAVTSCDSEQGLVCAACTQCAPGFASAAPCAPRADTLCVAVSPPPEILPAAGDGAPFAGYVLVSVAAHGAGAFVNLSLADGAPPTCEGGLVGTHPAAASILLRSTAAVAVVACAVHPAAAARGGAAGRA